MLTNDFNKVALRSVLFKKCVLYEKNIAKDFSQDRRLSLFTFSLLR